MREKLRGSRASGKLESISGLYLLGEILSFCGKGGTGE